MPIFLLVMVTWVCICPDWPSDTSLLLQDTIHTTCSSTKAVKLIARVIQIFPLAQTFMLSRRRQRAKAKKSTEMGMMSDFDNKYVTIGNENINPNKWELANTIEGSTRRPLSNGIFSATLLLQKSMAKKRIEPTTYKLGNTKKFQAPARVRTYDLLAGRAKSEVHFTRWS